MEKFNRKCPKCGKIINYSCKESLRNAEKVGSVCYNCKKKNAYENKKYKNNAKILLNNSLISFYWIGFILADGSIDKNKRISITLKKDDKEHLEKFKTYVNAKTLRVNKISCSTSIQDCKYIPKLCEIFDIKANKTIYPPNLDIFKNMEKNKLLSLIIGFIDGDGRICNQTNRKDFVLQVKNHRNWEDILDFFNKNIDNKSHTKINNCGYAAFNVTNTLKLKELKRFAIENNLPILKRKWDVIDLNFFSRTEIAERRKNDIKLLYKQGYRINEISKKLNLKYGCVYAIIQKYSKLW